MIGPPETRWKRGRVAGRVGDGVCVYTRGTRGQSQQATHAAVPVGLGVVWVACAKNEWLTQVFMHVEIKGRAFHDNQKSGRGGGARGGSAAATRQGAAMTGHAGLKREVTGDVRLKLARGAMMSTGRITRSEDERRRIIRARGRLAQRR